MSMERMSRWQRKVTKWYSATSKRIHIIVNPPRIAADNFLSLHSNMSATARNQDQPTLIYEAELFSVCTKLHTRTISSYIGIIMAWPLHEDFEVAQGLEMGFPTLGEIDCHNLKSNSMRKIVMNSPKTVQLVLPLTTKEVDKKQTWKFKNANYKREKINLFLLQRCHAKTFRDQTILPMIEVDTLNRMNRSAWLFLFLTSWPSKYFWKDTVAWMFYQGCINKKDCLLGF